METKSAVKHSITWAGLIEAVLFLDILNRFFHEFFTFGGKATGGCVHGNLSSLTSVWGSQIGWLVACIAILSVAWCCSWGSWCIETTFYILFCDKHTVQEYSIFGRCTYHGWAVMSRELPLVQRFPSSVIWREVDMWCTCAKMCTVGVRYMWQLTLRLKAIFS